MLMPWLLVSLCHQHPQYWLCKIGPSCGHIRYECVYKSLIICHFKLNWFILMFFIAIRCSMCLISFILLTNISIDGIVFKHLQAYRYGLVMMNIRLNKSWYWKSVIPSNCSFSVNWLYIPVSVCNFTNNYSKWVGCVCILPISVEYFLAVLHKMYKGQPVLFSI